MTDPFIEQLNNPKTKHTDLFIGVVSLVLFFPVGMLSAFLWSPVK